MSTALTVVGIADCAVSADPGVTLATYALGSCIAVSVWDPQATVGGLLHFMLPESSLGTIRGRDNPFVYADTGIAAMLKQCTRLGASVDRMVTRAVGGARLLNDSSVFNIGIRNAAGLRETLSAVGLRLHGEALGGGVSRSVRLEVGTGRLFVRTGANAGVEMYRVEYRERKQPCF